MWDLSRQISQQQEKNNALKARNETLDAEVRDLKSGRAAIEERARSELGMIKQDEVFYQVLENTASVNNTKAPVTSVADQSSSITSVQPKNIISAVKANNIEPLTPSQPAANAKKVPLDPKY